MRKFYNLGTREVDILAHRIRISEVLPWDKNLILPMLSYPGRPVTTSCKNVS